MYWEVFPSLQQGLWAVCWGTSRGQGSLPIWGVFHAAPRCAQSRRTGGRNGSVVRGSLLLLVAASKIDVIATYMPQWSPASSRLSGITKAVLLSRDRARLGTPALGMGPARSCQSRHVRSPHCLSVEGAGKGGEEPTQCLCHCSELWEMKQWPVQEMRNPRPLLTSSTGAEKSDSHGPVRSRGEKMLHQQKRGLSSQPELARS